MAKVKPSSLYITDLLRTYSFSLFTRKRWRSEECNVRGHRRTNVRLDIWTESSVIFVERCLCGGGVDSSCCHSRCLFVFVSMERVRSVVVPMFDACLRAKEVT